MPDSNAKATRRERELSNIGGQAVTTQRYYRNGAPVTPLVTDAGSVSLSGKQVTVSIGNPFHSKKKGARGQDLGGPFFTQKKVVYGGGGDVHLNYTVPDGSAGRVRKVTFDGPIYPVQPTAALFPPALSSSNDDLDEYGTTAIAECKPTNPIVDLTAALTEIRNSGLPVLPGVGTWRDRTRTARNAGDEYLNVQFGWLPLASDISSFGAGVMNAASVIEQYKAGIGKWTRRSFDFPIETSSTTYNPVAAAPWSKVGVYKLSKSGYRVHERNVHQRRWFRGAFTYYFPFGTSEGKLGDLAILARQLGIVPTPETVWNVSPWSWAIDWFSNAGDVISNVTSFLVDGLVMPYGYIMEHTIVSDTYRHVGAVLENGDSLVIPDLTFVTETKLRREATPFGFGLIWDGLSSFQTSILGALGLTKFFR